MKNIKIKSWKDETSIYEGRHENLKEAVKYCIENEIPLNFANLLNANLSGTKGLKSERELLEKHFKYSEEGLICYKIFNLYYKPRVDWIIEEYSYITEVVNSIRTNECGSGVNVGSLDWIKKTKENKEQIWECLIEWKDLSSICVPYHTNGKIRANRVKLIKKL